MLTKEPKKRLGQNEREIRDNVFFRRIDWEKIEAREVQPPYIPKIVSVPEIYPNALTARRQVSRCSKKLFDSPPAPALVTLRVTELSCSNVPLTAVSSAF